MQEIELYQQLHNRLWQRYFWRWMFSSNSRITIQIIDIYFRTSELMEKFVSYLPSDLIQCGTGKNSGCVTLYGAKLGVDKARYNDVSILVDSSGIKFWYFEPLNETKSSKI